MCESSSNNFCSIISFKKTGGQSSTLLPGVCDYLLWYGREKTRLKYHSIFFDKRPGQEGAKQYNWIELADGTRRVATEDEQGSPPKGTRIFSALSSRIYGCIILRPVVQMER